MDITILHSMHNCKLCVRYLLSLLIKSIIIYDQQTVLLIITASELLDTAVHVQAIKAYRGSSGIDPSILNLATIYR